MISIGCDHGGYELKEIIRKSLEEKGIEYRDYLLWYMNLINTSHNGG
ncbi:RpiB/LacA/LacB family sugar-phosphate isomerase [Clostridium scatologenes]|uniref:Ribose-5-phosphate isomerase B n=1 Tax=Clostridium scatologenes TaxID=1548 RepID=A0A0E3JWS9_CLOSL|nr:hypothetical protein CSCA_0362 [Clostridium scatologenes]